MLGSVSKSLEQLSRIKTDPCSVSTANRRVVDKASKAVWAVVGFPSHKVFKEFLESELFKPHWDVYVKECLAPARASKTNLRGGTVRTVVGRIIEGEKGASMKFSKKNPNKRYWDSVDHKALLFYDVRSENSNQSTGILYGKGYDDPTKDIIVWQIIDYAIVESAPSRVNRGKGKQVEESAGKLKSSEVQSEKGTTGDPMILDDSDVTAGKTHKDAETEVENASDSEDQKEDSGSSVEEIELTPTQKKKQQGIDMAKLMAQGLNVQFSPEPIRTELQFDDATLVFEDDHPNGQSGQANSDASLTPLERLVKECTSKTMDLSFGIWQCYIIQLIYDSGGSHSKVRESIGKTLDPAHMMREESQIWFASLGASVTKDAIEFKPFDEKAAANHDRMERYLDNVLYQRDNLEASCQRLGIDYQGRDQTRYHIKGMAFTQQFQYWQPVAINWLLELQANPNVRGGIIADYMGIGKTYEAIGFLVAVGTSFVICGSLPASTVYYMGTHSHAIWLILS